MPGVVNENAFAFYNSPRVVFPAKSCEQCQEWRDQCMLLLKNGLYIWSSLWSLGASLVWPNDSSGSGNTQKGRLDTRGRSPASRCSPDW